MCVDSPPEVRRLVLPVGLFPQLDRAEEVVPAERHPDVPGKDLVSVGDREFDEAPHEEALSVDDADLLLQDVERIGEQLLRPVRGRIPPERQRWPRMALAAGAADESFFCGHDQAAYTR